MDGEYTVVLDTEPSENVTITVVGAPSEGADITVRADADITVMAGNDTTYCYHVLQTGCWHSPSLRPLASSIPI